MSFIPNVSLGENALIRIDFARLLVQTGNVRESPQEISLGCPLDGGYTFRSSGFSDISIDAKCQWTTAENVISNPPALIPGGNIALVFVYPDFKNTPTVFYYLPIAYVVAATCEMDCGGSGGVVSYSISLKNQGVYYTPSAPNSLYVSTLTH